MEQMTIELKEPKTDDTKDVYNGFIYLNHSSIIQINLNNSIEELSFIIFQVHSHLYKVTMYRNKFQSDTYEYGTNIGLYSKIAENDVFYIKNMNNDIDLKLYLAIQGYKKQGKYSVHFILLNMLVAHLTLIWDSRYHGDVMFHGYTTLQIETDNLITIIISYISMRSLCILVITFIELLMLNEN